ncbi:MULTISPECIES: NUDIX domain-containing protein [Streptomyces]|uniref:NUDIX domain-containing protein n=1 Tax=Streptomyces TaxID=1883 RepID=UPI00298EF1EF|nr:NUDIX domain-containing protein [Streptomyces koyangensis]
MQFAAGAGGHSARPSRPGARVRQARQRHNALRQYLTPGGHLEPEGTRLMGAALRELTEETGIRASIVPLLPHRQRHSWPSPRTKRRP